MTYVKILWALLTSLPDIIKLVQEVIQLIEKIKPAQDPSQPAPKVADVIKDIHQSINQQDPKKIDYFFSGDSMAG